MQDFEIFVDFEHAGILSASDLSDAEAKADFAYGRSQLVEIFVPGLPYRLSWHSADPALGGWHRSER